MLLLLDLFYFLVLLLSCRVTVLRLISLMLLQLLFILEIVVAMHGSFLNDYYGF